MFFDLCFPLNDLNKESVKKRVIDLDYQAIAMNCEFDSPAAVKPLQVCGHIFHYAMLVET